MSRKKLYVRVKFCPLYADEESEDAEERGRRGRKEAGMSRKFLGVVLGCLLVVDLYPVIEGIVRGTICGTKVLYEILFLGLYFATAYFWGRGREG